MEKNIYIFFQGDMVWIQVDKCVSIKNKSIFEQDGNLGLTGDEKHTK